MYSIIIPAYNEESNIAHALQETCHYFSTLQTPFEIIIVNDGSQDRTGDVVKNHQRSMPQLRLVTLSPNQGKGSAVRAGVCAARGDIILFLDTDLSTHPTQFKTFLPHLNRADILIGSRGLPASHITVYQPWYRSWTGKLFNRLIRHLFSLPFRDTQCGFKVFHRRTLAIFEEQQTTGWAFDVELLVRARQHGFRIKELPVHWKNDPHSKVKISSFFALVKELHRIRRITHSKKSRS